MTTVEEYKELCKLLNDLHGTEAFEDYSIHEIATGDVEDPMEVELNGETYDFSKGWRSNTLPSNDGTDEYWYWQVDPNDDHAIFVQGYYDSWAGSSIESDQFNVGTVGELVLKYMTLTEV